MRRERLNRRAGKNKAERDCEWIEIDYPMHAGSPVLGRKHGVSEL